MPAHSLSKPLDVISPRYDVIVVGSGYGGGVAASRLARAGRRVCVLERGRERVAGGFGHRVADAWRDVRLDGRWVRYDNPSNLYDVRLGRDMHTIVANGLGGGSLINGAVALRADSHVLSGPGWPRPVTTDGLLDEGYARAERMLGVTPVPDVGGLAKFALLQRAGGMLGSPVEPAPTTITYRPGTNRANVVQYGCRGCGDCWSGCNVGAKNTVALTYLADAAAFGAELFTLASVRRIARHDSGWSVHVVGASRGAGRRDERVLRADMVVLAAGTLGSTEILLRSRASGLPVSARLGESLSGNGDEMFIAADLPDLVNGVGTGFPPRRSVPADAAEVGPPTTGSIRFRDDGWEGRQILIQDGAMLPVMAALAPVKALTRLQPLRAARMLRDGPYAGHRARTAVFYTVSDDDAAGRMTLEGDRLVVDWPNAAGQTCFERGHAVLSRMVEALGGRLMPNPLSERMLGGRKVTVHPLGGCAMGVDAGSGVVDDAARVFDPTRGPGAVHDGLLVCDGSVMRGALGVNPLLTITALAERAMMLAADREGWRYDDAPHVAAPLRDAYM